MVEETKNNKKISLSATLIATIVLIAVIVTTIMVWTDYTDKRSEIDILTDDISQVHQRIRETPEPADNLEAELEMVQARLTAVEEAFPHSINRNDVIDYILNLAEECQVEIIPLVSQGWSVENTVTSYHVLKLRGTVTGNLSRATNFISELQDSQYSTLTIKDLTVTRQNELPDENSNPENDTPVTVRLNIALYTYSPLDNEDTAK